MTRKSVNKYPTQVKVPTSKSHVRLHPTQPTTASHQSVIPSSQQDILIDTTTDQSYFHHTSEKNHISRHHSSTAGSARTKPCTIRLHSKKKTFPQEFPQHKTYAPETQPSIIILYQQHHSWNPFFTQKIIATHVITPLKTRVLNNNETHHDHPLTRIHYQIKRNSLNDMTLTIVQTTSFSYSS